MILVSELMECKYAVEAFLLAGDWWELEANAVGGKHVCNSRLHTATRRDSGNESGTSVCNRPARSFLPLGRRHMIFCTTVAPNCFE
jgi:hypothetical protein